METEIQKISRETQELYKSLSRLDKEGYRTFENEPHYQGYGYKVVLENTWVDVWLCLNVVEPSVAIIRLFEKNSVSPNVLDSLTCKVLAEEKTTDFKKVYDIVQNLINFKQEKMFCIKLERFGYILGIAKVKAKSLEEAKIKMLLAFHDKDDIYEISEEEADKNLADGDIDFIMDEFGNELESNDD